MKHKSFSHMNCSIAQTLDVVGERWALLIVKEAFAGLKRFTDFQKKLGVAKNILADRLNKLDEEGILKRTYPKDGGQPVYELTDMGADLHTVLISLMHWGDKYKPHPNGTRFYYVNAKNGDPIQKMAMRGKDGRPLKPDEVKLVIGPGMLTQ